MNFERVFLVGFMCSGKSTLGRLLSERLGWKFVDTDEEIEKLEGASIPEIFEKKGEDYFRRLELEVLSRLVKEKNLVISTGGGLGANPLAMDAMKGSGLVVWLNLDFQSFLKRCGNDPSRPLLKRDIEELLKLFKDRAKVYQRAHLALDATLKPEVLVEKLLENIGFVPYNLWTGG
ncbi:MAG: shikimate kinase [Aquificaceae bacterium]|nr:shikimate kinase [Aquificaceae bacterium]